MKKEFVTYTQSLALKELGFDEPCLKTMLDFDITYESNIKMPLKPCLDGLERNMV